MSGRNFGMNSARKRKLKAAIFAEQSGICFWCQRPMHPERASFDHLLPKSRGGGNERANLVLAHQFCNFARGDQIWPFGKTPLQNEVTE